MKNHTLRSAAIATAMMAAGASISFAQGAQSWRERTVVPIASVEWTGPRLADGQPDVQGHWSNTIGNHNNFTRPQGGDDGARRWRRGGRKRGDANRAPSRVSDPQTVRSHISPGREPGSRSSVLIWTIRRAEYVEPLARCAPAGPTKSFMWHGYEIRQYPGYVLFLFDSGTRIIHLDAKPHLRRTSSYGTATRAATGKATRSSWTSPTTTRSRGSRGLASSSARTQPFKSATSSTRRVSASSIKRFIPIRPCSHGRSR